MSDISNEELSEFLALYILRWHIWENENKEKYYRYPGGVLVEDPRDPSKALKTKDYRPPTDLNQAMDCVEETRLSFTLRLSAGSYTASFRDFKAKDKSRSRAVCLALKTLVESKTWEGGILSGR